MKTLFHRCGQVLDVADKLGAKPNSNEFVFLDQLTGDGYDRCPSCDRELRIEDFRVQRVRVVSLAKPKVVAPPVHAEGRRLINKARRIARRISRVVPA